jgi:hypothetical protein
MAITIGRPEVLDALLTGGVPVHTAVELSGETALHRAVRYGRCDLVAVLLRHGADAFATTAAGVTPLDGADDHSTHVALDRPWPLMQYATCRDALVAAAGLPDRYAAAHDGKRLCRPPTEASLLAACRMGSVRDVDALLTRYGVSATAGDSVAAGCLQSATISTSWSGTTALVQRLLTAGVSAAVHRDDDDMGVLHFALAACCEPDRHGQPVLHYRHLLPDGVEAFTSALGMLAEAGAAAWDGVDGFDSPVRTLVDQIVGRTGAGGPSAAQAGRWMDILDAVARGSAWSRRRAAVTACWVGL